MIPFTYGRDSKYKINVKPSILKEERYINEE